MVLKKLNLINFQTILICLVPFFLIFSIFLADLTIVILNFFFFYQIFKSKKFYLINNIYFKIFFSYWVYIVILSFFSENILLSLKSSFFYIRFIAFPFIIWMIIRENKNFLKYFFYSTMFLLIILACDGFFEYFFGRNIMNYQRIDEGRIISLFKNDYVYGTFLSKFFFPISCILFFVFEKNKNLNVFFLIYYILTFFLIFISGDRTPLYLFVITSILLFFLYNAKLLNKVIVLAILLIFICSNLILNKNLYDRIVNKTLVEFGYKSGIVIEKFDRLTSFEYNSKTIKILSQHQTYLIISYNMFKDKPVFGHGNRAFKILSCEKYKINIMSCASHPHNIYLQLLVENGLPGFILFVFIFFIILYLITKEIILKFLKKNSLKMPEILIYLSIFLNFFPFAQTGNFFGNWNSILFFLPLGLSLGLNDLYSNKSISYNN